MEVSVTIKVKPFRVPNYVLADKKTADPANDTKLKLEDLDTATLNKMCDEFKREVFNKAKKELK